ncbi:MAG: amidase [Acetobacteraceae bacterium]|nr:amidase [Acetobacteraceae bacterium]
MTTQTPEGQAITTPMRRRDAVRGLGAAAAVLASNRAGAIPEEAAHALSYQTARDLVNMLAARQISARELLDSVIARIEALDAKFNAVVVRDFDRARTAADTADTALARGERRPLLGLPMTVKEQFNVAGLPTTWGFPQFRDWRPEADALAVQRLKAAGAVIIGKTNVPMNLTDWQSYNDIYGTTNNPWDVTRTPGGSSGGSAAALAAGFVPLELGSDIGGSLRAPAHFCGVFAHKPSLDLIPSRGAGYPGRPATAVRGDMAVIGPMARSASDLALELDVLAGPDELWEGIGYKLALPPPRHDKLADFRVLVIDAHPLCPTAASMTAALHEFSEKLAQTGCTVLRNSANVPDLARTTRDYTELLWAFFGADLSREQQAQIAAGAAALSPQDQSLAAARLRGLAMSHSAWVQTSRARQALRAQWQALFRDIDVLLCPPMPSPAFPQDHSPIRTRELEVDGKKIPYSDQIAWVSAATFTGLPATVAPLRHVEGSLPVGVQIIGGYLEDRTTIAFAELIEREFGGFTPPANL